MASDIVKRLNIPVNQRTYDALLRIMERYDWPTETLAVRECIKTVDFQGSDTEKKLSIAATPEAIERWKRGRG